MTDNRKLFGTDGIRGVAEQYPLDRRTTRLIGIALGHYLKRKNAQARVVIGEDTRESSRWIAGSVAAGLSEVGVETEHAGVITTPGVAFLARTRAFSAGVVISASHNPWQDNGIKIFGHDGYKLPDRAELEIEGEIFNQIEKSGEAENSQRQALAQLPEVTALHKLYVDWLVKHFTTMTKPRPNIVADCANGAASVLAGEVFAACGIEARLTHHAPNGRNINENCGALHPEVIAREVKNSGAEMGVTFDGDADRCLFANQYGNVVNGDAILLIVSRNLKAKNQLRGDLVVATTMSNMGLEAALRRSGIKMLRAPVGDKYVLEEMKKTGAMLGGEQSGHIIFQDGEATTGDGLLTALRILQIVVESGKSLAELTGDLHVFPQIIKNIRVREKKPFAEVPMVQHAIQDAEALLGEEGRVVVRYSGTEALARVMVEAASDEKVNRCATAIADVIQRELGIPASF